METCCRGVSLSFSRSYRRNSPSSSNAHGMLQALGAELMLPMSKASPGKSGAMDSTFHCSSQS